jgi:hypothetical protein
MKTEWSRACRYLVCGGGLAVAQMAPPRVPTNLQPPATEALVLRASGRGRQIYVCQPGAGGGAKFAWVLEKPEAELVDSQGKIIGRHYEGPTWEGTDGSKVVGELEQRANAPRAGAIPWLLLKAKRTEGAGRFGRVTYIQRVDTKGGAAPAGGCDESHAGKEVAIEYEAEYYFYGRVR